MPPQEARAWWADVEHLREDFERRRARREGRDGERRPTPLRVVEGGRASTPRDSRPAPGTRRVAPAERRRASEDSEAGATVAEMLAPIAQALRSGAGRLRVTLIPPGSDHEAPRTPLRSVEDPAPLAVARPTSVEPPPPRAPGERRTVQIRGRLDDPPPPGPRRHHAPRRAPRTVREQLGARPDRVAGWAFALCVLVILVAATTAGAATTLGDRTLKRGMEGRDVRHLQLRLDRLGFYDGPADARYGPSTQRAVSGYQRSRCLDADGIAGPATVRALRANRRACRRERPTSGRSPYVRTPLGTRTLRRGDRGRDVRVLQRLVGMRSSGDFGPRTLRAVRRFQRSAGLQGDGIVGPTTRGHLAQRRMAVRGASWYGPGLYGRRTACGQELTTTLQGVAHRRLPCGTRVTLAHNGRFVTVPVVDRGPYVDGLTFDLAHATARTLGFSGTQRLRARY